MASGRPARSPRSVTRRSARVEDARLAVDDRLPDAPRPKRDDWSSRRHGFERGDPKVLDARDEVSVAPLEQVHERGPVDVAKEAHCRPAHRLEFEPVPGPRPRRRARDRDGRRPARPGLPGDRRAAAPQRAGSRRHDPTTRCPQCRRADGSPRRPCGPRTSRSVRGPSPRWRRRCPAVPPSRRPSGAGGVGSSAPPTSSRGRGWNRRGSVEVPGVSHRRVHVAHMKGARRSAHGVREGDRATEHKRSTAQVEPAEPERIEREERSEPWRRAEDPLKRPSVHAGRVDPVPEAP